MILLIAVALGFAAGLVRARITKHTYQVNLPSWLGLLFTAALLQALAFSFPPSRAAFSDWLVSAILVSTQVILLVFIWINRRQPGFILLGLGLALNLLVIVANGGWMPVSPQIAAELFPGHTLETGQRVGWSKDILLPTSETRLWQLSDFLLIPAWFPWRFAFSPGDLLIAIGVFYALWARGGPAHTNDQKSKGVAGYKHITPQQQQGQLNKEIE